MNNRLKRIRGIKQRSDFDCGYAALAMLSGNIYDEVMKQAKTIGLGTQPLSTERVQAIGSLLGMNLAVMSGYRGGVHAILNLPSLNNAGGAHAVYIENYKVFDPQRNREGKKWYDYEITGAWPSCMTSIVDLNNAYSLEVFTDWMDTHKWLLKKLEPKRNWEK